MPLSTTRHVIFSIALLLCSGIFSESSAQQPAFTIVTSGGPSSSQIATAIAVTPSTPAVSVAQAMAARPAGSRILLLSGFADDLTSSDTVVAASKNARVLRASFGRTVTSFPSPWLDNGIARARQRASAWVAAYRRANGVAPDLVVIRCRATMAASNYLSRVTPTGWATVCSDRRFAALASSIGVPDLQASMFANATTRAAWDKHFSKSLDSSIEGSVGAPFSAAYGNAVVCMEDRYAAGVGMATIAERSGSAMRVQQVPFSLASSSTVGFGSVGAVISDLRVLGRAAALVPSINAPGSAQWSIANAVAPLPAVLQAEIVRHVAAIGIRYAWSTTAGWNSADGASVLAAVRDANTVLGSSAAVPSASTPSCDSTRIFVSGSARAGVATWRISMADGVQAVRATFADGGFRLVMRDSSTGGAWFSHPESARLESVQAVTPAEQSSEFVMLSDDVSAPATSGLPVRPYMIVYQGVDPQSYSSGRIDVARVVAAVGEEIAAGRGSDWGVLDFEDPFNEIMSHGASDPRFAPAMASLVETLRAVKSAYPGVRWTYYNFPTVPYWIDNRDWNAQSALERINLQSSIAAKFAPLMDEVDWFLPSIYDRYEGKLFAADMLPLISLSETSFREATVGFLQNYMAQPGKVRRPIIPIASPWFIEGGRATQYRPIPGEEFLSDQIRPAIMAGADGIALWCSTDWLLTLATRNGAELPQYAANEQVRVRNQFQLDLLGDVYSSSFDWTSASNKALVRARLTDVVAGAVAAIKQTYAERASSSPGMLNGSSVVSR